MFTESDPSTPHLTLNLQIHLVCVLKGGSAFFQDLLQSLRSFHEMHDETYVPFTYDFIRVKSYDGINSTRDVQIIGGDLARLNDRNVLLVEDIIDTGEHGLH